MSITYTGELVVLTCWCGIAHAVPDALRSEQLRSGRSIYCPLGHEHVPSSHSETQRLKDELARARAKLDQTEASERAARAAASRARNERDRMKTRSAAGVCPCCNRTFQQLARHMKTKHPTFNEKEIAA